MSHLICRDSRVASAFGALMFAGLAFGAALYPLLLG
jgi:tetrahydromethanopterin S-methyltransferase subunit F